MLLEVEHIRFQVSFLFGFPIEFYYKFVVSRRAAGGKEKSMCGWLEDRRGANPWNFLFSFQNSMCPNAIFNRRTSFLFFDGGHGLPGIKRRPPVQRIANLR